MNVSELKQMLDAARSIELIDIKNDSEKGVLLFEGIKPFERGINNLHILVSVFPQVESIVEDDVFKEIISAEKNKIEIGGSLNSLLIEKNRSPVNYLNAFALRSKILSLLAEYKAVKRAVKMLPAPDAGENSISIKISKVRDLDDLYKAAQDFNIIFSQLILNEKIGGSLGIKNVENGSIWLDVFVGTPLAVSVIGSLTWAAAVVYKKVQEGRVFAEYVKSLKIKNDSLSDMRSAQDLLLKSMIEIEARNIETQYFSDGNNEQLERIKNSISLLASQIEKGSEVHPYLNAPEDVKNLFPDMKKLPQIESKIPRLSE